MTTVHTPSNLVIAAVDYSETGDLAFDRAYAQAGQVHGELHVVSAVTPYGSLLRVELPTEVIDVTLEQAGAELKRYVEKRLAMNDAATDPARRPTRAVAHLRVGSPAEEVAQLASDLEADLVIVGSHGRRGVRRLLLGSVSENVVRMAPCPVLVVRPRNSIEVPAIEPPCPRCVEARFETKGEQLWCAQHNERHGRRHTYSIQSPNLGGQNMPLVLPE